MEEETYQTLFNSFSPHERVNFFIEMMNSDDVKMAMVNTLSDYTTHESVELYIAPEQRFIVGTDSIEEGDLIHIYSNSIEQIDGYVKELFESGEIMDTILFRKRKKLYHRMLLSVNPHDCELLPIIYN